MSSNDPPRPLLDQAALAVQALRDGTRPDADVLVRIDNTAETEAAPYQFDANTGKLHRRGCRAIPDAAPLYARWHLTRDDLTHACKRCKPLPDEPHTSEPTDRADLLFGLFSLVDQFSGVLKQRGKDYQKTDEGQALSAQLGSIYRGLGRREKEMLDTVLGTLDALVERLRALDRSLNSNGADGRE
jgi:hypothetical protein